MPMPVFSKLAESLVARLPAVDEDLVQFWLFFGVLIIGGAFYSAILLNMLDKQTRVENLQRQLDDVRAEHQILETQIIELNRLNTALLPSTEPDKGLDWETLKYLSFARFHLIAENEGIIHFKEEKRD